MPGSRAEPLASIMELRKQRLICKAGMSSKVVPKLRCRPPGSLPQEWVMEHSWH